MISKLIIGSILNVNTHLLSIILDQQSWMKINSIIKCIVPENIFFHKSDTIIFFQNAKIIWSNLKIFLNALQFRTTVLCLYQDNFLILCLFFDKILGNLKIKSNKFCKFKKSDFLKIFINSLHQIDENIN